MQKIKEKIIMVGEEQIFIDPWMGIINSIIPALQLIFIISICGLVMFIVWKRQPFKKWAALVLIKHRRGNDYSPEFTEGRRIKNKEGQSVYKCKNGEEIPAQYFKDLRRLGKKAFVEVWEDEAGKFMPAPSPYEDKGSTPPEFSQADVNWLIQQHQNNIRMFEKKSAWKEWIPIIAPAIIIIIAILGLVLYQTQVMTPLIGQAQSIASSNAHSAAVWQNVTNAWSAAQICNNQAVLIPTGK